MSLISTNRADFEDIRNRLAQVKPGRSSHMKVSAVDQQHFSKYYEPAANAHEAAVMLVLVHRNDQWQVIFMKRASHKNDKHSGQISFPGGRKESTDPSLLDCAYREIQEEIGIAKDQITIIGELSPLYVFVSNHMVYTYVGVTDETTEIIPNEEVAEVVLGTVEEIASVGISYTTIHTHGTILDRVPYYNLNGHILWGATAMIFTEFLDMLYKINN